MYHKHFGLNDAPFSISVNPRYLFMSQRHRDALAHLLYGVGGGGGFILLTGEVGTGKTTVNRCLLEQLPDTTDLAIILNPALSALELLATACDELDIDYPKQTESLKALTDALHQFLLANFEKGRKTVLMIDEAQHLDFDVLEQIRLLTNLETNEEKLLQIILIGQPELTEKLARPELRQLNQRITARYNLQPLNQDETTAYIRHRLEVAGLAGGVSLFDRGAVRQIHALTRGIPRLINVLCDRALLGAYGQKRNQVNRSLVRHAASEVFGDARQPDSRGRMRVWGAGAVVLSLAIALVAVNLEQFSVVLKEEKVSTTAQVDAQEAVVPESVEPMVTREPTQPNWELGEAAGLSKLWLAASDLPVPASICPPPPITGIRCTVGNAQVWNDLASLNRPVLLATVTADKFQGAILVVQFEGADAVVWSDRGLILVPLSDLATAWTGGYTFLWQVPKGWQGPIAPGESGLAVSTIAEMFATLDGMTLGDVSVYGPALEARVRLFQQSEGLDVDGVIGERTVLRLNTRLGIGLTSARALSRAQLWAESR